MQKADAFDAALGQTGATIAETEQRIRTLKRLAATAVPRRTTQIRTSDNPQLLEQLKSTLLNLELKRTEWMDKYDPSYRPVRELETEIAQTRASLAAEEKLPLRDETTDRDPTFDWVNEELAKATTDLASLRARAAATAEIARAYQDKAHRLGQDGIVEQDLIRDVKTQEGNYALYLQKQEEARISDALDSRGILNATIAETAAVPTLPSSPPWPLLFLVGSLTATVVSLGSAFTSEYLDPFLRTPREVEEFLGVPVLAAIPDNSAASSQDRQHPSNPFAWIAPSEVSHRNSG